MKVNDGRENAEYYRRKALKLEEEVSRLQDENNRLYNKASEFYSISLWCARRLSARIYAKRAYDDIEKVLGYEVKDRDWRGEQV